MTTILHVDMDAFYASVEQRDDPSLRGKPLIVGGGGRRGVVTAASYEVRPFGVRSAMSMVEAMQRCPHAVVVPPRMGRYVEVSAQVFAIFGRYTPIIEGLSLDEAFLDVTGSERLFGSGEVIAERIRREIHTELGLTASAGVAPNKFLAKLASDMNKPNGVTVVPRDPAAIRAFLAPMPIERMWGVGKVSAVKLRAAGFQCFRDFTTADDARLQALLGNSGPHYKQLALGIDDRAVEPEREAKTVGAEHTFETDIRQPDDLHTPILEQCARVASRLTRAGLYATVLTLKVKYGDHTLRSRQQQLDSPARDTDTLYQAAKALLGRFEHLERGVRLTGISAGGLTGDPATPLFGDPAREKRERLESVSAALRERFGERAIERARLVDQRAPRGFEGVSREMVPVRRDPDET
ncbi:MAG: DNA polymerase IV [Sandaracinaceae bacterium]|nr:DNA polymerase IV [Sandaracinaceae bacterium]MBP7681386.1 DNA polymerase IV [Deltaproteobacteria bacterium]